MTLFLLPQVSPFARGGGSRDVDNHGESQRDESLRAIPTLGFAACHQRDARRGGDSGDVENHGEPRRGKGSRAIPKL